VSDDFWKRPAEGSLEPPAVPAPIVNVPYTGAPRTAPPPAGWRPPVLDEPVPPRVLPTQDTDRLDREEQAATILTKGIGIFAGAVLVVLLLILCGNHFF
jgi:hypothetical protein